MAVVSNGLLKQALQGRIAWKGNIVTLVTDAFLLLKYPLVWLGAAAFITTNVLWLLILATQRMSVAYPLQLSLVFLFSTLVSVTIFSERLTPSVCLGLVLVISGIVLVSKG